MPLRHASFLSDVEALRGIIDAVPHPIFVKDSDSRFLIVNDAMCQFMGRQYEELIGKLDDDFVPKEQAQIFQENDRRVLRDGVINENEEPFTDRSGEQRTIVTRKSRLVLTGGERLLIGCITDISDFRRAEAAIRYNAEHDHLTGLANRLLFRRQLESVLDEKATRGSSAALLLIDLDGFKDVNDSLGHGAGDNILVQTANALTDLLGRTDDVARLGGDEFAVIQHAAPQPAAAIAVASAIVQRLAQPTFVGRRQVAISVSVGIAFAADARSSGETWLKHADLALYAAKKDGRNCWRLFEKRKQHSSVEAA
jgi:diguanylate cyclase (GGDEF)-like protein/PAS domain S-box-containing protein